MTPGMFGNRTLGKVDKSKAMLIFFHKKVPLPLPLQPGGGSKRRPGLLFKIKDSPLEKNSSFAYFLLESHFFFFYFVLHSIIMKIFFSIQVNYIQKGNCYDISER